MLQGMDLHVTMDYIDGVWDAHDKNGDGVLDDEEFGSLLGVLRKSDRSNIDGTFDKGAEQGGCSVKWMVLGLLAAAFVRFYPTFYLSKNHDFIPQIMILYHKS